MKKKVGILTYHDALNYGAVLQAFALRRALKKTGKAEVEVLDYKNPEVMSSSDLKGILFHSGKKGILLFLTRFGVIKRFQKFRQNKLHLSKPLYYREEFEDYVEQLDYVIVGSDQVWNEHWNDMDGTYFLDVAMDDAKKCSYAASFGFEELEKSRMESYRERLSRFAHLSVREKSAKKIVNQSLGLACEQHVDPVLLLRQEEWIRESCEKKKHKPYLFLYLVPYQREVVEYAKKLAKEKGLQVCLGSRSFRNPELKHVGTASPERFLGWMRNADLVVTNSFHGAAFAMIFEKDARIILDNPRGYNVRSRDLLASCKLTKEGFNGRMVSTERADWTTVRKILEEERAKAYGYFEEILGE